MKRRNALKSVALGVGALAGLPAWANGWNRDTARQAAPLLSPRQDALLAEIAETIIPTTDTPGAKELGVHTFVQKMVADCYEPKAQAMFTKGLETLEATAQRTLGKSFAAADAAQRTELLKTTEANADTKAFFQMVKNLTIRGYLTSEYVMTNLTGFQMAPGYYKGCVPVKKS